MSRTAYATHVAPPPRRTFTRSLLFHLLLVLVVLAILYFLFFSSLAIITRHGDDAKVPKVTGKDVRTAVKTLEGMGFEVRVDSTYVTDKKALLVLDQKPDVGDVVKKGRILFLTVNKLAPPPTPMPNLVNLSFRSAVLILKSNHLIVGDTTYKPNVAEGAILDALYDGKPIRPGQAIPQGSRIDLIIGGGLSTIITVQDVIGMTYYEAIAALNGSNLQYTAIFDPDVRDTATAKIYRQTPNAINDLGAPAKIPQGDFVDIYIGQNPSDSLMDENRNAWKKNLFNNTPSNTDTNFH